MPRNLEEESGGMPQLSPEPQVEQFHDDYADISSIQAQDYAAVKDLHPYAQILGLADVESCLKLEEATFPPHQRCSREKFIYRLTACSELCLGLFTPAGPGSSSHDAATASTATHPDSASPERKGVLLAHLIATKTTNELIQDEDMKIPDNWKTDSTAAAEPSSEGHREHGRTIGIHSLAVLPAYQRRGLGKILMKSYIQRMIEADNADRIALLTYDRLVEYYEKGFGFKNMGKSSATFGGEEWNDMVLDFADYQIHDSDYLEDEED